MSKREQARKAIGGLSRPSKMPCPSWSIDARLCNVGSELHKKAGSVCEDCYALKGMYHMPNVKKTMKKRYQIWKRNRGKWVDNFVLALEKEPYFRWFDSGDLQGPEMLQDIVEVVKRTPWCQHWLPTKESWVVAKFRMTQTVPTNLIIRQSLPMVGQGRPAHLRPEILTAGVVEAGESCPAKGQGHKCLDCRTCWSPKVKHVTYRLH